MADSPFTRRRLLLWGVVALCALGLLVAWGLFRGAVRPASPLVLMAADLPWEGFSPNQQRGLFILLRDELEMGLDRPVANHFDLQGPPGPGATLLKIHGHREGSGLRLSATLQTPGRSARAWEEQGSDPRAAFRAFLRPLRLSTRPGPEPLSADPALFWELAEATGSESDAEVVPFQKRMEAWVHREPGSAAAWLSLAILEHQGLILASTSDPVTQAQCREHFERALKLRPDHPRGTHSLATFLTDTGNQREAIDHLLKAVKRHPKVGHLRSALAYAARTAGLLEGAALASAARDRLQGPSRPGLGLADNVHLYRGDWDRFEKSLGDPRDPDPVLRFYRGYIRLLRGDRTGALAGFRNTRARTGTRVTFEQLALVYELALEDRKGEALKELDTLRDQRLRLRVPDGEFTFKLAEAYGFLGQPDQALLVAERAFAQGFGCTRWYEASPMLAAVRTQPRWIWLVQHLRERQALLETRYPVAAFGD